jgi:nucleoside-specific outer membrane channel protein Tsx
MKTVRCFVFNQTVTIILSLLLFATADGADFSTTNIQLLKGSDYKLGAKERNIITVEHFSAHGAGDVFFFLDSEQTFNPNTSLYGELTANWSSSKLFRSGKSYGSFIKDISLATSLELSGSGARLVGLSFDLAVPHFQLFRVTPYLRNKKLEPDTSFQLTWAWALPFAVGPTKWVFEGFIDYADKEGGSASTLIAQPQLLLDLMGLVAGKPGKLLTGIEYGIFQNKFGIDGEDEKVMQCMVKWIL